MAYITRLVVLLCFYITCSACVSSEPQPESPPGELVGSWTGGTYRSYFSDGSEKGGPPIRPPGDTYTFRADGTYRFRSSTNDIEGKYTFTPPDRLDITTADGIQTAHFTIEGDQLRLVYYMSVFRVERVEYFFERNNNPPP